MTYELLYLTSLQESDAARTEIRERVTKTLQDGGATVIAAREFARQRLSYPVKKQQAGEYTVVEFTCPGRALAGVQRELRLFPDMLRLLVTEKVEARAIGQEIEATERARAQEAAAKAVVAERAASVAAPAEPIAIEDLDKKLEEILGKEMV